MQTYLDYLDCAFLQINPQVLALGPRLLMIDVTGVILEHSRSCSLAKVLIIFAHPHLKKSLANRQIVAPLLDQPQISFHNLYDTYPNFFIDVQREQQLLLSHDVLVFQHPFYWYSVPALLKQWMDDVLELGFAYGKDGDKLHGKKFLLSITTGGAAESYSPSGRNHFNMETLLTPYRQTAYLCGWDWQEPLILHSAIRINHQALAAHAQKVKETIFALRDQ